MKMKTFTIKLTIRAECKADAEELINNYVGQETDVKIQEVIAEDEEQETFNGSCPNCNNENIILDDTTHLGCSEFTCVECGNGYYIDENNYIDELIIKNP